MLPSNVAGTPARGQGRTAERDRRASACSVIWRERIPAPCKMGLEGIVSKRLGSRYRSGRSKDWLKFKNPEAPAVKREAEEEWAKGKRATGKL